MSGTFSKLAALSEACVTEAGIAIMHAEWLRDIGAPQEPADILYQLVDRLVGQRHVDLDRRNAELGIFLAWDQMLRFFSLYLLG